MQAFNVLYPKWTIALTRGVNDPGVGRGCIALCELSGLFFCVRRCYLGSGNNIPSFIGGNLLTTAEFD